MNSPDLMNTPTDDCPDDTIMSLVTNNSYENVGKIVGELRSISESMFNRLSTAETDLALLVKANAELTRERDALESQVDNFQDDWIKRGQERDAAIQREREVNTWLDDALNREHCQTVLLEMSEEQLSAARETIARMHAVLVQVAYHFDEHEPLTLRRMADEAARSVDPASAAWLIERAKEKQQQ